MTTELNFLALSAFMTSLLFLPYVLERILRQGLFQAMSNTPVDEPKPPSWATRAAEAHKVAVENLPIFGALVVICQLTNHNTSVTAFAAALYFFSMLAHYVVFTLGIPYLRTLCFLLGGFGAEVLLALSLFNLI